MDKFGQSAMSQDELFVNYGLTERDIIAAVKKILRK